MIEENYKKLRQTFKKGYPVLKSLVISAFKGQYRYSRLGILWQVITPIIMIVLFYIVFTSFRATDNPDFWLLLCTGIFPYMFMEASIITGSQCIINNASLVKKMSFPKQYIVYAHVVTQLVTFIISFTIIIILQAITNHHIDASILVCVVLITTLTTAFNFGMALFLSSVVVYVRDLGFLINACSRLLFWTAPTIYSLYEVTGMLKTILLLNPMTYFIARFQDLILYSTIPPATDFLICMLLASVMIVIGKVTFQKLSDGFAERL